MKELRIIFSCTKSSTHQVVRIVDGLSCFLNARGTYHSFGSIWLVTLCPSGKSEVVLQHMFRCSPFDDIQLRMEFQERLNKIPGVDLPVAKIELRPGFPSQSLRTVTP